MKTVKPLSRTLLAAACVGLISPMAGTAAYAAPTSSATPILQCRASAGATNFAWTIELDDAIPLAIVNNDDTPADYSAGHVRVRLAPSGPTLVIGLISGRLLMTASDGRSLGSGQCERLMAEDAPTHPGRPCADSVTPISRSPGCSGPAISPA